MGELLSGREGISPTLLDGKLVYQLKGEIHVEFWEILTDEVSCLLSRVLGQQKPEVVLLLHLCHLCKQSPCLSLLAEERHGIRGHPADFSDYGPMCWWGRLLPSSDGLHVHGEGKKQGPVRGPLSESCSFLSAVKITTDPDLGYLRSHWPAVRR